jgi:type IV secretory pathway TrbL component
MAVYHCITDSEMSVGVYVAFHLVVCYEALFLNESAVFIKEYPVVSAPFVMVMCALLIFLSTGLAGGLRAFCFKSFKLNDLLKMISEKIDKVIYCVE